MKNDYMIDSLAGKIGVKAEVTDYLMKLAECNGFKGQGSFWSGWGCGLKWTYGVTSNAGSSLSAVSTSLAYTASRQWASRAAGRGGDRGVVS